MGNVYIILLSGVGNFLLRHVVRSRRNKEKLRIRRNSKRTTDRDPTNIFPSKAVYLALYDNDCF